MRSLASQVARNAIQRNRIRTIATLKKLSPSDAPLEEELNPDYEPHHFHAAAPGDLVANRYSIISKLGWGRTSTVWLAQDRKRWHWQSPRYVSIKFNNCDVDQESIQRERAIIERLLTTEPKHLGYGIVRQAVDYFELESSDGTHLCTVYKPLRETLNIFRRRLPHERVPIRLLKAYAKILLAGLDYIHTECNMVHTDLKLDNILVTFEDDEVLNTRARDLQDAELLYKDSKTRRVFQSENNFGPVKTYFSTPIIADFGLAQDVPTGAHPIQPDAYRSPEVLLGWGWSYSADIWNLGHLIWTLATGSDLFHSLHTSECTYDAREHLAQMIAVLGPPEPALIKARAQSHWKWTPSIPNAKGQLCDDSCSFYGGPFFDPDSGEFLHTSIAKPRMSLQYLATFVDGEEKELFLDFLGKMLSWDPDSRAAASDLFHHPWLHEV